MSAIIAGEHFGRSGSGEAVEVFELRSAAGMQVRICTFGGAIISLRVPDARNDLGDVVLGYDSLQGYLEDVSYFGVLVGRYANRIRRGQFVLDGEAYALSVNNGPNHLHGGSRGFGSRIWRAHPSADPADASLELHYTSAHLEEGYPGVLHVSVTYTATPNNELMIEYRAHADRATPVNLTQHSYFNLTGNPGRDIRAHELTINAHAYTPVDEFLIPTGEIASVRGTPFDFTSARAIGARLDENDMQLLLGQGYDHNYVLNGQPGVLACAAVVHDPMSGRVMEIHTTEPGLQFYSGNYLDGIEGKDGTRYQRHAGFCLEPQHFPNSPNTPAFPSTILRPGQQYRSRSVYRFGVRNAQTASR